MIDGKTIADLRIRLLTMRVAEAKKKDMRSGKCDLKPLYNFKASDQ